MNVVRIIRLILAVLFIAIIAFAKTESIDNFSQNKEATAEIVP